MVGWGWGRGICLDLRVDRNSLVGNIGDISVVVVGGVLDVLGSAVGKSNRVRSGNGTVGISGLSGIEGGLGVIISNSVGVGVGLGDLLLLVVGGRGVVGCRGGGVIRSGSWGIGGSCVDKGSSVD